jgi:outer membrane protein assembly factor BamB
VTARVWRTGLSVSTLVVAAALALVACGGHGARASTAKSVSTAAGGGTGDASAGGASPSTAPIASTDRARPGDWIRFDYDVQRSGVGPSSTRITAGNVGRLSARTVAIDGVADSSPVELHDVRVGSRRRDVIFVTTTYGKTIAIDPGNGARLWEFTPRDISGYEGGSQITSASPVVDPDRQHVWTASPDGFVHELAVGSGRDIRSTRVTFDPTREKLASALNVVGRYVIAVTGGYYGDAPPYQGHVVMIDRASGRRLHVFNTLCSSRHALLVPRTCGASDSAIWARAGAVVEPDTGRLLVATGNGPFDGAGNWGDSVLELSPDAGRLLHNWTPHDQSQLSATDTDLGSTAPAILPRAGGRRLVVQGGKDGQLKLLDLARLNGTNDGPGSRLGGELQRIAQPGSSELFSQPAVWRGSGKTFVFVANEAGTSAYVLGGGRLHVAWHVGKPGTSPIVAGGLLYIYDHVGGKLNIYRPASGGLLASRPAAPGHWNSPIAINGRVVLPVGGSTGDNATSGVVVIYHLPGR